MKEAPAPAADESATRGVSPPGAPPTSPSTVTSTTTGTFSGVHASPPGRRRRRTHVDLVPHPVVSVVRSVLVLAGLRVGGGDQGLQMVDDALQAPPSRPLLLREALRGLGRGLGPGRAALERLADDLRDARGLARRDRLVPQRGAARAQGPLRVRLERGLDGARRRRRRVVGRRERRALALRQRAQLRDDGQRRGQLAARRPLACLLYTSPSPRDS